MPDRQPPATPCPDDAPADDPGGDAADNSLEAAIGARVRSLRQRQGMRIRELAEHSGVSRAMLSKIENGLAAPSLSTLKSLAEVFSLPVSALFRDSEVRADVSFVRAGEGVRIRRQGDTVNHDFRLLGHSNNPRVDMRPYLVELTAESDVHSRYQDTGVWFLHLKEGEMDFRCGNETFHLRPGDSLMYDAESPNGPEKLRRLPVRYLCIRADARPLR